MVDGKFRFRQLLKDKRFWLASFLIGWAGALQLHMSWLQRQEAFKQKFLKPDEEDAKQSADY